MQCVGKRIICVVSAVAETFVVFRIIVACVNGRTFCVCGIEISAGRSVAEVGAPREAHHAAGDVVADGIRIRAGVVDLAVAESASGFGGDRLAGCRVLPYDREAVRNRGGVTRRVHVERQGEGTRHVHGFLPPD